MMTQPGTIRISNDHSRRTFCTPGYRRARREMSERARSYKGPLRCFYQCPSGRTIAGSRRSSNCRYGCRRHRHASTVSETRPGWSSSMLPQRKDLPHQTNDTLGEAYGATDPFCRFRRYNPSPCRKSLQASWNGQCGLWLQGAVVTAIIRSLPG